MHEKVLKLERTKEMFQNYVCDDQISVYLPQNTDYMRHARMIISMFPKGHRFKVGITNDAENRYYGAFYAYSNQRIKKA